MPPLPSQLVKKPMSNGQRLAVNICDLDRVEPVIMQMLLGGKLDIAGGPIRTDPSRLDEGAVAFCCDLLTAACCCDTLRIKDRTEKRYPTRVYVFKERAWMKVAGSKTLSAVVDGVVVMNPKIFRVELEAAPVVRPPIKRLKTS